MRILFLITSGRMGGLERHVHCLVKSLPETVESRVCVFAENGGASEAMIAEGLPVTVLGGRSGHDWRVIRKFSRLIREFKPDIVHIHSLPIFAYLWIKLFTRIRVIVSLHMPCHSSFRSGILNWLCRGVDYYLPVSETTWQGYKQINSFARGEVFFNPLRLNDVPQKNPHYTRHQLGLSGVARIIGYVARLECGQKNWVVWLDSMFGVLSRREDVHAVAVGDGPDREMLHCHWKELTEQCMEVRSRLHWLGQRQDAKELMGGMDLFVMTSNHEELPTMMLEAFAMRTPVVGNLPVGGAKEVLVFDDHVAELRENATVKDVVEMVLSALDHPDEMVAMAERARQVVERHFDAERLCRERLVKIYSNLQRRDDIPKLGGTI